MASFISHRRGIYYALLTIAFGQIFWFVAIKWHSVTRGEDGLLNTRGELFLRGARHIPPELPQLVGPEASLQQVAHLYLDTYPRLLAVGMRLRSAQPHWRRRRPRPAAGIIITAGTVITAGINTNTTAGVRASSSAARSIWAAMAAATCGAWFRPPGARAGGW